MVNAILETIQKFIIPTAKIMGYFINALSNFILYNPIK